MSSPFAFLSRLLGRKENMSKEMEEEDAVNKELRDEWEREILAVQKQQHRVMSSKKQEEEKGVEEKVQEEEEDESEDEDGGDVLGEMPSRASTFRNSIGVQGEISEIALARSKMVKEKAEAMLAAGQISQVEYETLLEGDKKYCELESKEVQISKRWADRLSRVLPRSVFVSPTSRIDSSSDGDGDGDVNNLMHIKPLWPEWLVDETFEVQKYGRLAGALLKRTLKLTDMHVLGISDKEGVTKRYAYADVESVSTRLSPPGEEAIMITFKSDGKSFIYITPMAAHIAQQISTRKQLRQSLDSSSGFVDCYALGFAPEALLRIIKEISAEHTKYTTSSILAFSRGLVERVVPLQQSEEISLGVGRSSVRINASRFSSRIASPYSSPFTSPQRPAYDPEALGHRLLTLSMNTKEAALQHVLRVLLHEEGTAEGNTREQFVKSFDAATQGAQDVRAWIEGMHEYILRNRGVALSQCLSNFVETNPLPSPSTSTSSPTQGSSVSAASLHGGSSFASGKVTSELAASIASITQTKSGGSGEGPDALSLLSEDVLLSVSYIIFNVVEEAVFLPLRTVIDASLTTSSLETHQRALVEKIHRLQTKSQQSWGIPQENCSSLEWRSAIFELKGIEQYTVPSRRLTAVVLTAKAIFAEHAASQKGRGLSESVALGADDLLPIFIFVLVRAGLETPLLNKDLLWSCCHPDLLYGEAGYYLTVYESAISFLEDYEL